MSLVHDGASAALSLPVWVFVVSISAAVAWLLTRDRAADRDSDANVDETHA